MPAALQDKVLKQLHLNLMAIEKIRLLACESICWIKKNVDIEEMIKNFPNFTINNVTVVHSTAPGYTGGI